VPRCAVSVSPVIQGASNMLLIRRRPSCSLCEQHQRRGEREASNPNPTRICRTATCQPWTSGLGTQVFVIDEDELDIREGLNVNYPTVDSRQRTLHVSLIMRVDKTSQQPHFQLQALKTPDAQMGLPSYPKLQTSELVIVEDLWEPKHLLLVL
jgi:hypothetical protein